MNEKEMRKNYNYRNPVIQTNYTSDPAPMVYNDRVYLYTGHDEDGSTWFTMNEWRCYSSADMVNGPIMALLLATPILNGPGAMPGQGSALNGTTSFIFMYPLTKKVRAWL